MTESDFEALIDIARERFSWHGEIYTRSAINEIAGRQKSPITDEEWERISSTPLWREGDPLVRGLAEGGVLEALTAAGIPFNLEE